MAVNRDKGELKLENIEDIKVDDDESRKYTDNFNDQVNKRVLALKKSRSIN